MPKQMSPLADEQQTTTQALKGRMYTTEGQGVNDATWGTWMNNPSIANADAALSSIRAVFAVWNYMNGISSYRTNLFEDRRVALAQFDDLYARVCCAFTTSPFPPPLLPTLPTSMVPHSVSLPPSLGSLPRHHHAVKERKSKTSPTN